MKMNASWLAGCAGIAFLNTPVAAQESARAQTGDEAALEEDAPAPTASPRGGVEALIGEIVVTARKRGEERIQDVAIAATAFGPEQLEAQNFRDLTSISFSVPNVQLESLGSVKGVASFSIRGLGINSSIPSIDPTVGVFVDGVYLGITSGVILDNFDIAGLEVLRGPQGVLFGRNVTGGAVLLRTTEPTDTFTMNLHAGVETGTRYTVDGVITGPLVDRLLSGKVAAYYSKDEGWFDDNRAGPNLGKSEALILRGALKLTTGAFEAILRYDHNEGDGDGPVPQNHAIYSRNSYDYASGYAGFFEYEADQVTLEANLDVGFGDGTITSITGYRRFEGISSSNVDGTFRRPGISDGIDFGPGAAFNLDTNTLQDQLSQELRYAGTFGRLELTTGLYYFTQDLTYVERRLIDTNLLVPGASVPVGGGIGDFSALGAFAAIDYGLTYTLTVNAGLRYTKEDKKADISRIRPVGNAIDGRVGGIFETRELAFTDTGYDLSFDNWSPKIGLDWEPTPNILVYGFWTRGYRSGGINLRNTALGITPRPFGQEEQSTFEIGGKFDLFDRRLRINGALFTNDIKNLQREQITADPISGVQQIIANAGDARIRGFEVEANLRLADNLLLSGQVGHLDGEYTTVIADITGDGLVDRTDLALKIPRLAPWTYGATLTHDLDLPGFALVTSRFSWNHRDANFFSDNNRGFFDATDILDLNITLRPDASDLSVTFYGTNLTNETTYGSDTLLPDIPQFGGDGAGARPSPTYSPLNRGRVLGVEMRYRY